MEEEDNPQSNIVFGRPTRWPVAWGVVAIVFGFFGVLAEIIKALQAAALLMAGPMIEKYGDVPITKTGDPAQDAMTEEMLKMQQEILTRMQEMAPMTIGTALFLCLLAVLLLVGGILLCVRKKVASPLLQTWAVLKIIGGGFGAWLTYRKSGLMMGGFGDAVTTPPGSGSFPVLNVDAIIGGLSMGVFILHFIWILWLPVFFLIWFNRPVVEDDMNSGPGWGLRITAGRSPGHPPSLLEALRPPDKKTSIP